MALLIVSILILLVGPLLCWLFRRHSQMLTLLDGFNFVAIAGLVLFDILPHAYEDSGAWILLFVLAGLIGPTIFERYVRRAGHGAHMTAVFLAILGLCVHAMLDGAALIEIEDLHVHDDEALEPEHHSHGHSHLPLAVILHRIPVGLTVWMLLRPGRGRLMAWGALGLIAICTGVGFELSHSLADSLVVMGNFQALVAGTLLHVVVHRPHRRGERQGVSPSRSALLEGLGGLVGLGLLLAIFGESLFPAETGIRNAVVENFVRLFLESAPALLLGYLMAGFVSALLPSSSIGWMKLGAAWNQSLRGMAIGLPIPVCSCGVVPIYRSLVQRGAPATAAMAFLVATPELGFDAVFLSISLLGVQLTILRVVSAAVVALLVGWMVGGWTARQGASVQREPKAEPLSEQPRALSTRLRDGLNIGFGEVVDHTAPWIVLGIAVAAIAGPLLESDWLTSIPAWLQVPMFALLGIPTYVCASGATPLVAVLIINGLSPGAAIAFLLTGPATNVTTFGVLSRLHSRSIAAGFGAVMLMLSVVVGLLVNGLFPGAADEVRSVRTDSDAAHLLQKVCLVALAVVYVLSFLRRGPRNFIAEIFQFDVGEEKAGGSERSHGHPHDHGHGHGHDHGHRH